MSRRLQILVLVVCGILLLAIALPPIETGRQAARQMQSRNNLKQLGLALYSYHDTYRHFPLGADADALGPKHGWFTRLMPYIEASSLYNRIDMNVAWEHPFNGHLFQREYGCVFNPQFDWRATREGYGLLHYTGNPSIVHRNSQVRQDDLTAGLGHSWLVSEIGEDFHPWGYPFNWRTLSQTVASQSQRPTLWQGALQVCRADGSVTLLSTNTDGEVIRQLDGAPPAVDVEQTMIPPRDFELEKQMVRIVRCANAYDRKPANKLKGQWARELVFDYDDVAHTFEFSTNQVPPVPAFRKCIAENPDLRVVILRYPLNDNFVRELAKLKRLEALSVAGSELTEGGFTSLAELASLRILAGINQDSIANFQRTLPKCQIFSQTDE